MENEEWGMMADDSGAGRRKQNARGWRRVSVSDMLLWGALDTECNSEDASHGSAGRRRGYAASERARVYVRLCGRLRQDVGNRRFGHCVGIAVKIHLVRLGCDHNKLDYFAAE